MKAILINKPNGKIRGYSNLNCNPLLLIKYIQHLLFKEGIITTCHLTALYNLNKKDSRKFVLLNAKIKKGRSCKAVLRIYPVIKPMLSPL